MRLKLTILVLFIALGAQSQKSDLDMIKDVMASQEKCWNDGDLDCFMVGYWKSDSLIFCGKSGPTYGWQKTLDNYKKGYSRPEEMGKLTFTNLEFVPLENAHYLVVGKWHLERKELDNLEGHYSLVWRKIAGEWVIIADHSS